MAMSSFAIACAIPRALVACHCGLSPQCFCRAHERAGCKHDHSRARTCENTISYNRSSANKFSILRLWCKLLP
eukprot:6037161-Alexandrium_andersonii.AAC.1